MGRAKNQRRRAAGAGKSAAKQLGAGLKFGDVTKRAGTERPGAPTESIAPVAKAAVIKTNS